MTHAADETIQQIRDLRIIYPRAREVLGLMGEAHDSFGVREPLSLFVQGPPGVGKTAIWETYLERDARERDGKVVAITLPLPATPAGVLEVLLDALGDPFCDRGSVTARQRRLKDRAEREDVRLIVLDEMGHFLDSESHKILLLSAQWLKRLMMELRIPFVAFGAVETVYHGGHGRVTRLDPGAVFTATAQLSDRFQLRAELRPFGWRDPADQDELTKFLLALDAQLPFPRRSSLWTDDMAMRLYYASSGRMRPLMTLIREAATQAYVRGDASITLEHLARAFEKVCRTDDAQQAKQNPFLIPVFSHERLVELQDQDREDAAQRQLSAEEQHWTESRRGAGRKRRLPPAPLRDAG